MKEAVTNVRMSVLLCCLLFCCLEGMAAAQDDTSASSYGDESAAESIYPQSDTTGAALPADRIIEIIKEHPELLTSLGELGSQYSNGQNRPGTKDKTSSTPEAHEPGPGAITDEALLERIAQDDGLRAEITHEMRVRGYLSQADLEYLAKPAPESAEQTESKAAVPRSVRHIPFGAHGGIQPEPTPPSEDQNEPPTTRKANPYPSLPSLQDLYRQIPSQRAILTRFGVDVFRNGTGNLDKLPMDLPAGPDYVLGTGDGLNINIGGGLSRTLLKTIDREGRIALPEAGNVLVAGQTVGQAQTLVKNALETQFRHIQVDISLTRLRTVRVYVVGDVERPGAYDISSLSTPLNALYLAGGPTTRGSLRAVRLYRGEQLIHEFDLYGFLLQGIRSGGARLEPGDTILVPPVGPQVTVAGMVRRPAVYELASERELSEVLQLAGGVLVSANLRQIGVERIEAHERRIMLKVNLPVTGDRESLSRALSGFLVQDGDYVTISPILPYSEQTVYINGHVSRPGKYPYHQGMQISELLRSYQDLLPEPSDRAEIVRLVPPDNHPETIEFKLADVLGGEDPIELQPFDTVRIRGRYETDPPNAFIFGQVLRPGKYPLARGMTVAGLVRMAGGFTRSALTHEADITSYVVRDGRTVLTKHATVEIAKALSGDSTADVPLKPDDVLTVRQLTGWKDIGASVTIKGQVLYPGTYGIEDGERLSSLLARAGGFRNNAYPHGAVFERVQVRELAEKDRQHLITRIEAAGSTMRVSPASSAQEQATLMQVRTQQQQQILTSLRNQPATGRLVVKISGDVSRWQNSTNDIEVSSGDVLTIPKRPSFVLVTGQVYNAAALTCSPGKNAAWYLHQAGGPTELANKKQVYIVRADGSVVGRNGGTSMWGGSVLNTNMQCGDTVVVPEKIFAGSSVWKSVLDAAQLSSSLAIAAKVATSF